MLAYAASNHGVCLQPLMAEVRSQLKLKSQIVVSSLDGRGEVGKGCRQLKGLSEGVSGQIGEGTLDQVALAGQGRGRLIVLDLCHSYPHFSTDTGCLKCSLKFSMFQLKNLPLQHSTTCQAKEY